MKVADQTVPDLNWSGMSVLANMDNHQFEQWVNLLETRTGMFLAPERKSFLETSLRLRMQEIGYQDYQKYYEHVLDGRNGAIEWERLVDRLTVHETRFFRHENSINFLRKHCLPQRASNNDEPIRFQVWSAACSTGEEAYSLAMVIDHHLSLLGQEYYFGVTATDISLPSLAVGREGVYAERKLRSLSPLFRDQYFTDLGGQSYQIVERLRKRVCFAHANLLALENAPLGMMDVIYCQNLLIYFEVEKRVSILEGMIKFLAPGGALILGPGEMLNWHHPALERIPSQDTLAYRRHANDHE